MNEWNRHQRNTTMITQLATDGDQGQGLRFAGHRAAEVGGPLEQQVAAVGQRLLELVELSRGDLRLEVGPRAPGPSPVAGVLVAGRRGAPWISNRRLGFMIPAGVSTLVNSEETTCAGVRVLLNAEVLKPRLYCTPAGEPLGTALRPWLLRLRRDRTVSRSPTVISTGDAPSRTSR